MFKEIESFANEQALLGRIEQLRSEGVAERFMHVISKNRLEDSALDYTDVHYKNAEGSFGDKFAALFTGEDPEYRVFRKLDLSHEEIERYKGEVDAGNILLYVEDPKEYEEGYLYEDRDNVGTPVGGYVNPVGVEREERVDVDNDLRTEGYNDRYDSGLADNRRNYDLDEDIRNRDDLTDDEKIRLHEERLRVNKDQVQAGEVVVDKDVVEERQEFDVPVSHDEVTIERRKVNEPVREGEFDYSNDKDTIRVPLTEERVSIEKENVVGEELVIHKNRVTETEHVSETVRKEEADVHTNGEYVTDADRLDNDRYGNDKFNRVDNDDLDNDLTTRR